MAAAPVEPVSASTVILVRDGFPWECFMVRRHIRSDFAADVFVFPGGKVDPDDSGGDMLRHVESSVARHLDDLAQRIAAVRELFEEAGILLARDASKSMVRLDGDNGTRFVKHRRDLHAGTASFHTIVRRERLFIAVDALVPFSRWITPRELPRRFDTWFYISRLPEAQFPLHDRSEMTEGVWIAPEEALQRFGHGHFPLVFATQKHLERLRCFATVEALLEACRAADLRPVIPRMIQEGDETRFMLPMGWD